MSTIEFFLIMIFFIGFILGRRLPLNKLAIKKFVYNRRGYRYYVCHIIDKGIIANTSIVKEENQKYEYDGKEYNLNVLEGDKSYVPFISLKGLPLVFHNINNINPLIFKQNSIEPAYVNPEIIATFVHTKVVKDVIDPELDEYNKMRRSIAMWGVITIVAVVITIYLILGMGA